MTSSPPRMNAAELLTADRLRELLHYDPETGVFTRMLRTSSNAASRAEKAAVGRWMNRPVGWVENSGYIRIELDGFRYVAHRLAWLYVTGTWPESHVDHINCIRNDNRFVNLRDVLSSQNAQNVLTHKDNACGLKGVSKADAAGRWIARICKEGNRKYIGIFDCPAAAHFAYIIEASRAFGEFARVR